MPLINSRSSRIDTNLNPTSALLHAHPPLPQPTNYLRRKVRSIQKERHEHASECPRNRDGSHPRQSQQTNPLEVDSLESSVTQTDTDSRTGDAHGGGDGEGVLGEDEDGDGGAHFHGATSAGGVVGDLVAHDCLNTI